MMQKLLFVCVVRGTMVETVWSWLGIFRDGVTKFFVCCWGNVKWLQGMHWFNWILWIFWESRCSKLSRFGSRVPML